MADDSQEVADIIDGLGDSPAPLDVYNATRDYDTRYLASAGAAAAAAGGGGGSQPKQEWLGTGVVTIADLATQPLSFFTTNGDTLLDYTVPTAPVVLADGTYIFVFTAEGFSGAIASGSWELGGGLNGSVFQPASFGVTGQLSDTKELTGAAAPFLMGYCVCPMVAGDSLEAHLVNSSGLGGTLDFACSATLTKIS